MEAITRRASPLGSHNRGVRLGIVQAYLIQCTVQVFTTCELGLTDDTSCPVSSTPQSGITHDVHIGAVHSRQALDGQLDCAVGGVPDACTHWLRTDRARRAG